MQNNSRYWIFKILKIKNFKKIKKFGWEVAACPLAALGGGGGMLSLIIKHLNLFYLILIRYICRAGEF